MNWKILISFLLCCSGMIITVLAYQITIEPTPEWCYNLQSLGLFLFTSFPFFLVWGLSKAFGRNLIHWFRIPAIIAAYTTGFDFVKEFMGTNNDNSTVQVTSYCIGLILFTLFQYGAIKRHTHQF